MEEGTKSKKTIFIGGVNEDVDEAAIIEAFSTFGTFDLSFVKCQRFNLCAGDIIEVQLPVAPTNPSQQAGLLLFSTRLRYC